MRIIALLATYNEERFIGNCLNHLIEQGLEVYLIDNCSSDNTVSIASKHLGQGVVGIETFPRDGTFALRPLLLRKEELATQLEADWFMHVDADEIRVAPAAQSLVDAISNVDSQGYNAINFLEYTFVATQESPDHDHPNYLQTMRWYYPFLPRFPHRLNLWKRQSQRVDLASKAGHVVSFPGLKMYPQSFAMRHYIALSHAHIARKLLPRKYPADAVKRGWHNNRRNLTADIFVLPFKKDLRMYIEDSQLNPTEPRTRHFWQK